MAVFGTAAALTVGGCAPVTPPPADSDWTVIDFADDVATTEKGEMQVSVAVPDPARIRALFGLPLDEADVQPVWVRIRNNEPNDYWLVPIGTDPDYFSAHEVAWRFHGGRPEQSRQEIDDRLLRMQVHTYIPSDETVSGFLYVHRAEGVLPVNVDLVTRGELRSFEFLVPIAGFEADFEDVSFETLYAPDALIDLDTDQALRAWLAALPCCARSADGRAEGDPLNFVIVGERGKIISSFVRRGWNVTEATNAASIGRLVDAYLAGEPYRHAPVSPLYLFGRRHDIALQKARRTIHGRNHLRLWLAPARFHGQAIMVGQISRDIGIRFTGRLDPPTTHVIDPVVDDARFYLMQDLALAQNVARAGYVTGARRAPSFEPAHNLLGDPYYSDGLRGVLVLGNEPTAIQNIEPLDWALPGPLLISPEEN